MAFGGAHTLILPIGPKHLLVLGPENPMGTSPQVLVDRLNTVQVHAAEHYVYMHRQWRPAGVHKARRT
ncbi:hypothetical protein AB0F03_33440 [Streptomyces sp. NPDC028722]|uniref:hypothetical protein n=1 Tax=Streptomyces sp. NPDC028722 TaxID=3155016 RepID=UPI0034059FDA